MNEIELLREIKKTLTDISGDISNAFEYYKNISDGEKKENKKFIKKELVIFYKETKNNVKELIKESPNQKKKVIVRKRKKQ